MHTFPQVEGRLGTWTYIMTDLHQQRDPPALTMSSVYTLLSVVHKYVGLTAGRGAR
jgi:hypothetical protein